MENNNRGDIRLKFFADIKQAKNAIKSIGKDVEFLDKKVKSVRLTGFNKTQQKAVNKVAGGMPQSSTHAWYTQWATTVAQLDKVRAQAEIATTEIYKQLAIEKQKLAITQKSVELNAKVAMLNDKTTRTAYINNLVKEAQVQAKIQTSLAASKPYVDAIANRKIAQASIEAQVSKKMLEQADIIKQQAYYAEKINILRQQGVKAAQKEFGVSNKSLLKTASKFAIIWRLTNLGVKALKISADWTENLNLFAVTYGEGYEEVADWAVEFADKLGYSSVAIVKYTGLFKQLSDAIGVTAETGKELSKALTQIGVDIASFYNTSVESAMEKLQAGIFSGQTKPLRAVGIDVTYQSIDNLLKANEELSKLGVTSKQLTQDQKVLARAILVAQAGMNAWGDSAKTINTLANQIKVFQGSLQNLGLAIGDMLAPIATKFLTLLNGIIMAITAIIRTFIPMTKTVGYAVSDMVDTVSDEYSMLEQEVSGLLSFDKFEVLDSSEDTNATLALTTELQKVLAEYNKKNADEMERMQNAAIGVRNAILDFLGVEYNETTKQWEKTSIAVDAIRIGIAAISLLLAGKFLASLKPSTLLLSTLLLLLYEFFANLEHMKTWQKVVGIIAGISAAFFALAIAIQTAKGAMKAWSVIGFGVSVAAALVAINSAKSEASKGLEIKQHANGGTPERGELFSMNEYGRPEAFVKSGGHTSVINDITMGSLVKQGVIEAIRETGIIQTIRDSGANVTVEGDAQQMFKVIEREGRRRYGKGWGR